MPEPILPSPTARNLHNLSHLPYRSWCPHCVAARRFAQAHAYQAKSPHRTTPLIVFDYRFVKGSSDETLVTVPVARLYPSRALLACVYNHKRPDEYATLRLGLFLKETGYQKSVYKSDQEGSIRTMIDEALTQCENSGEASDDPRLLQTIPRTASWALSTSNGRTERAVRTFEDLCTTYK